VRHVREAVAGGDKDAASTALLKASKKLDKAVSKGVIHANQAANKKSALAKAVHAL
jgi:small subunit ribosomal protein S20